MSEQTPDPGLEGAGLSSTGTTADEFSPGEPPVGTTYGDPGGPATAEEELSEAEPGGNVGQDSSGDVEGAPEQP